AITDGVSGGLDDLVDRAAAAVAGGQGATCVQVRLKGEPDRVVAVVTQTLVKRLGATVPVLVNDRFDIALAAGAAGVHLGADDIPVAIVRRVTPPEFLIGTSVGCDAEVANAALADYVGIGPIYATGSKGDAGAAIGVAEFARLLTLVAKPAVGIGGITSDTAGAIIDAGGAGVAVIGAVFGATDPSEAAQAIRRVVEQRLFS
ncbi:MAG TPA: thiamine phosphate synthase, partial [Gemmatimonadaceae bacterium]|nr:thiamine phosphate synthase [Gemmatimonadaceae bacterium]